MATKFATIGRFHMTTQNSQAVAGLAGVQSRAIPDSHFGNLTLAACFFVWLHVNPNRT